MRKANLGSSRWAWMRSGVFWLSYIPRADSVFASSPRAKPAQAKRSNTMCKDYDFSKGK